MISMDQHQSTVSQISLKVRAFYETKSPFRIRHGSTLSTRLAQRAEENIVDVSSLRNVLHIDQARKTVLVEPNVSMDGLVKATLAEGLIPPVVMEFPNITVGGGFSGLSGESSSFRYGTFDHTVKSIEVVLGNGDVVRAAMDDPDTSDLFYGCAGSCGTLGVITLLEVQLIEARPFVELTYIPVGSTAESLDVFRSAENDDSVDYMDGILYSATNGVVMIGRLSSECLPGTEPQTFGKASDEWFYLHAEEILKKTKAQKEHHKESIPITDYLFRYDRGVFWAAVRAFEFLHFPFNRMTRYLLDPLMHTRIVLHALHRSRLASRGFIQDLGVPYSAAESFVRFTEEKTGIWPLWLCPVKPGQSFAFGKRENPEMLLDVGIWGFAPKDKYEVIKLNRDFEAKVDELGGAKVLYAQAFYTEDEFWNIYDEKDYKALRARYHGDRLPSVYDKVKMDLKGVVGEKNESEKPQPGWNTAKMLEDWPYLGALLGIASAVKKVVVERIGAQAT